MEPKNISYRSATLIAHLVEKKKRFFTIEDAKEVMPDTKEGTLRELLSDMTKRGLLLRIKRGLYHIIPYEKDSEIYFPDWHQVAEAIAPQEYYIGFYTALGLHNLITQPSMIEQIVTRKQIKPSTQKIKGTKFQFVTFSENKFFGFKKYWVNDYEKVNCSSMEKTIIDCLYKPDYGGGITEIAKAIHRGKKELEETLLIEYLKKYGVQAVAKRLGIILDTIQIFDETQRSIQNMISASYTPLDPNLPKTGRHNARWKIIENMDLGNIVESLKT